MRAVAWAAAALALALSACAPATDGSESSGSSRPGAADVDVDTPQLRSIKDDAGIAACAPGDASQVEAGLPNVTLPCLGGGPAVDVRSAAPGRPTLVNLWATWCAPCVDEVPELVDLAARASDRLAVVGVLHRAGEWVVARPAAAPADAASLDRLVDVINRSCEIGLAIAVLVSLVEIGREVYRLRFRGKAALPAGPAGARAGR